MSQASSPESTTEEKTGTTAETDPVQATETQEPPPSYVKLAMRNMVRKGRKSLTHFALTSISLLALLIGLAYLTR